MTSSTAEDAPVHIYFILDRSGSMSSIRSDVVGGFNTFLADQREGHGCVMTLVQFDTQDPYEVLSDACSVDEVAPMSERTFVPRAATPLYDAMGQAITNATIRAERRQAEGEPEEDVLFVTFTDGLENSSREYDREKIFQLIKKREERGWTFVYLGANQDAYAEGGKAGYARGSTQNWTADDAGAAAAFQSLSRATRSYRDKGRSGRYAGREDFFEGKNEAEDDLKGRGC